MKAIRLHIKQNSANYRREETVNCRMTYPLPPYSTVIGAIHNACGYCDYHPMMLSIQGKYLSIKKKLFREDCFLNSVHDDRGMLVKMCNSDILCSAYVKAGSAIKSQGNSFENGTTINVVNQNVLDEYRKLKALGRRIDAVNKRIKQHKDKIKIMTKNGASTEKIKAYKAFIKRLENIAKSFKEKNYTKPYSLFKTLTKAPRYYELIFDIELIIHIISDDDTMADILNNIDNFTAIGRGEDFIEILNAEETNLKEEYFSEEDDNYYSNEEHSKMLAYIPTAVIDESYERFQLEGNHQGVIKNGTKYFLNKNYTINRNKKRFFEKVSVLCSSYYSIDNSCDGVLFDEYQDEIYPVFFV